MAHYTRWRGFWWLIAGLVSLWLLWMTLRPNPEVAQDLKSLTAPATARGISYFWLIDIAGNIAVFAPLGAAVTLALSANRSPTARVILGTCAGLSFSVLIELLQGLSSSRVSSVGDVVLNVIGAALGALIALWFSRQRRIAPL
ncbi:MAG: VanZ family protein [Anaerolineae bacterium]|nr:VanZ family protein [Anaerolineae bacterium]